MELSLWFDHALGDCVYFAHILEIYRRRGYSFRLHIEDNKEFVFSALAADRVPVDFPGLQYVRYPETIDPTPVIADQYWLYNKPGVNVAGSPLPHIGTAEELWPELCSVRLNISPFVSGEDRRLVHDFLRDLPRPIVLVHSMGNTFQDLKNVPPEVTLELYRQLLDRTDGTLVLLDWDNRVPRLASGRVRHMTDDWRWIDVSTLVALMEASDLLISVDSGPLHLARMTDIPVVGVFPTLRQHPARVALPRGRTVNVVPREVSHAVNLRTRIGHNVVEGPGWGPDAASIVDAATRMLAGPRYLSRDQIGADVQLQQFVLEWERGHPSGLSEYNDRHRGFDVILRAVRERFQAPLIVETGCIRSWEDWAGAGYGTYLLGAFAERWGGEVVSVDIDPNSCSFARQATREMKAVTIVQEDSVVFLRGYRRSIDLLLLDSMDTHDPEQSGHMLAEAKAAAPLLGKGSLIVLDDTVFQGGNFQGAGVLAVPWLLGQGWRVVHSGYQTILVGP